MDGWMDGYSHIDRKTEGQTDRQMVVVVYLLY